MRPQSSKEVLVAYAMVRRNASFDEGRSTILLSVENFSRNQISSCIV